VFLAEFLQPEEGLLLSQSVMSDAESLAESGFYGMKMSRAINMKFQDKKELPKCLNGRQKNGPASHDTGP